MENITDQKQYPRLNGKRLKAFELKFDGETYQVISQQTGWSESWLRQVFMKEGKWRAQYDDWEDKRIEEIEAEGRKRIKKRISESLTVLEHNLTIVANNPREAARAARDLLDRAGLKAPEKIEITDPDDKAEKIMKALEKRKVDKMSKTKDNE